MEIGADTLNQVLSSLKDYNPTAYDLMNRISTALIPVAMVLLSLLLYMELAETNKRLSTEQGRLNMDIFIHVAWKYFVALALVLLSGQIIDSFMWLNSAIGRIINNTLARDVTFNFEMPTIQGRPKFIESGILHGMFGLAQMTVWLAEIVVKVLVFLRFFQLYLFQAAMPIMVSSYISEEWKSVATGFIKQFLALVIQGFLLILIVKLYSVVALDSMFEVAASGDWETNLSNAFTILLKSGVFIFTLIGSQTMAKRWMGV